MLSVIILSIILVATAQECQKRDYGNGGHVCVCTANSCDVVPEPIKVPPPNLLIYTSNKAGLRFRQQQGIFTDSNTIPGDEISINHQDKYQEILGWGGAFTDSAGINIVSLEDKAQENLLKSYFSKDGINYDLCKVPIGGTDFSEKGYTYDDGEEDPNLVNFQLAPEDLKYKIPLIKRAFDLRGGDLRLFASAWTAPKWMKTNGKFNGFGFLKKEHYKTWVDYFVKFFDEYRKNDINFWGLTTGNEPSLAFVPFNKINSVGWLPNTMGDWIKNYLGPIIRNSTYANLKLLALDDQRLFLPWFVEWALRNKTERNYIDGIGVHWYQDWLIPANVLKTTHDKFPEKFLLSTEACEGYQPFEKAVELGSWQRGEQYSSDIIAHLLNWVTGWIDWNMALDLTGGPTYIDKNVDSPIIVNASSGEFYKQPMFYNLGHFSKFVSRGSIRIGTTQFDNKVPVVAFQRPDNATVVIILNKNNKPVFTQIIDDLKGTTQINLTEKSITTVIYW